MFRPLATLKIWQKMTLVAIVMAVPLVTLMVLFIGSRNEQIQSSQQELSALDYETTLRQLLEALPRHRDLVTAVIVGDSAKSALADAEGRKVDDAIAAVNHLDDIHSARLGTGEKWAAIRSHWNDLKNQAQRLPLRDNLARHAQFSGEIIDHMRFVADRAGLTTDPGLDSYYLWDSMLSGAIVGADYASQLKGLVSAVGSPRPGLAVEDAAQLMMLARAFQSTVPVIDRNANSMFRYNQALKSWIGDNLTSVSDRAAKLNKAVQTELAPGANSAKIDVRSIAEPAAFAATAYWQLFDRSEKVMADLISARIRLLDTQRFQQIAVVIAVAFLAILLVHAIARGVSRQVSSMTRTFAKITDGDLRARAEVHGNDELGRLAISLNSMADNTLSLVQGREERDRIQESITKLLEEVSGVAHGDLTQEAEVTADITGAIADSFNYMITQLRDIISNVQKTTKEVNNSATDVRHTAAKLAEGSEIQARQIVQASSAIADMARQIQLVSQSATQATQVANQVLQSARGGAVTVRRTIEGMNSIRTQVQETAKRIKRLGESSQEIGEIVQLIGDIADRTSILALNASIQAAMAGDAGKGFGVVAEEVERLADRAAESTKKIANLIKSVQGDTSEAIAAMEETTREVVGGSQLANDAGQRLDEIEAVSRQITLLVEAISEASRAQASGSEAVSKNVAGISSYTQQTAAGAQQAEELIRRLADLTNELNSSLKRFKVPQAA